MSARPLAGVRVIELANRSAALAGRILADLGAEVIMVEPPGGSQIRHEGPHLGGIADGERSFAHLYFDINKLSVVLDLDDPQDMARFEALVSTADVLIDTEAPGRLDALGAFHARLRSANPGLIQCSVTPFGLDTAWKDRAANDLVACAAGGLVWVSGSPRGVPVQGAANPSYTMAGLAAASAVMIALHQRDLGASDARGSGQHIDISLQEAAALAVMQTNTPSAWVWHKRIPARPGLSAAMPCRDGKFVGLLVRPDRFDGFLAWAEREGIDHGMTADDWHYARLESPRQGNPVSETTLALAAKLTRDQFVAGALEADIICLPVLDFPDLEKTEQFRVNDQFIDVEHELFGTLGSLRSPVDAVGQVPQRRAPLLGEHQDLAAEAQPVAAKSASAPAVVPNDPARALEGLRVVDFGWVLAAPIGTRILASFGAEVIRVESSTKPDSMRSQIGPDGKPDPDLGGLHNVVNAGKKSLAVDLTTDAGRALVIELIATADVVVNNFRPGSLERMGLGYEVLQAAKPDLILLNMPGAHRHGPWARRPSMGNILMAASGFNMLTGFADERPRGIGVAYPDFTSPHLLVSTVLAAVRQREKTGEGAELHLPQLSGLLSLLGAEWMQFKATGAQPAPNANRHPDLCPHGVFRAADEMIPETGAQLDAWVAIAVDGQDQWRSFCQAAGHVEWLNDERFATHADRKANEDALDELINRWSSTLDKWQVTELLQAAGIAAAPVENLRDMLELDPQLGRHYQQTSQPLRPDLEIPVDREAARWVGAELWLDRSPAVGEHNEYVVQTLLGRTDDQFVQLMVDGTLG
ncbi:MAG: CoA transferase [Acidimicrobiales bacterium]|nr:CoA transferase [Acidimicrobiales bacterium]